MEKTLHNSDVSGAKKNVKDICFVGNGDLFQLLCKASSQAEGWMKSTKAMEVPDGCVVQVTTHQRNHDGTNSVAEALTYVPGVMITDDINQGRKLTSNKRGIAAELAYRDVEIQRMQAALESVVVLLGKNKIPTDLLVGLKGNDLEKQSIFRHTEGVKNDRL